MKPLFNIYLCLFASLLFIAACNDSDEEGITGFTIDTQEVTLGATGGMEPIKVASGTKWVAKVDKPWVKVMPANGVGSTNCEIVVDSTLSNDVRHAVVTFVPEGQPKQELKIHQTGYGKMIGLDKYEVEVPNMGNADKRYLPDKPHVRKDGAGSRIPRDRLPPVSKGRHRQPKHGVRCPGNIRRWQHPQKERNIAWQPDRKLSR